MAIIRQLKTLLKLIRYESASVRESGIVIANYTSVSLNKTEKAEKVCYHARKKMKVVLPRRGAMDETTVASIENVVRKRRLLFISTQSLFGTGIISLIEEQNKPLVIEKVADAKMALEICGTFKPDVVVDLRETSSPEDQSLLQVLGSRYHTRVVHCALQANHLTIYDRTRIKNATVEDLISAVLK